MRLNKDLFNPAKFNICSLALQKRMAEMLFNNSKDSLKTRTQREFNFKILDEDSVSIENKIMSYIDAAIYAEKRIHQLFQKDGIEIISTERKRTKSGNFKLKLTFEFIKDEDLWIIDNYKALKNVQSSELIKRKKKGGYKFDMLGFKVKLVFGTNSINNGKYIEKANKLTSLYDQIEYLRMLINEELLVVL